MRTDDASLRPFQKDTHMSTCNPGCTKSIFKSIPTDRRVFRTCVGSRASLVVWDEGVRV
jgi:hypothetical protein